MWSHLDDEEATTHITIKMPGTLRASVRDDVDKEPCVLPRYITQRTHVDNQVRLMKEASGKDWFPVYWEVEVADEWNGWFRGVATAFNDSLDQLQVLVPDERNPVYNGRVPMDWRVVRLRHCLDVNSMALFNELVRASVLHIAWEVEWLDTHRSYALKAVPAKAQHGAWHAATARYYVPILNTLLVEDDLPENSGSLSPGRKPYAVVQIRQNLRLHSCPDGRGMREFENLVFDEGVRCTEDAKQQIKRQSTPTEGVRCCLGDTRRPPYALKPRAASPTIRSQRVKPSARQPQKAASTCVICMTNPLANVALVPCGHQALCLTCLGDTAQRNDLCPICRAVVRQRLTIFSV